MAADRPTAARWSPSPPTSARARSSGRRATKALLLGIKPENIFIEDLREEFVRDYVFPMFRANAVYEGQYLLGTSIARPLIAKTQIDIAGKVGADAVGHGATGKGNDQVRYEVAYYALEPDIRVIAPWREWDLLKRREACSTSPSSTRSRSPRTSAARRRSRVDANLLHSSSEGKVLEDPAPEAPEFVYPAHHRPGGRARPGRRSSPSTSSAATRSPSTASALSPASLLTRLNELGHDNGVGRLDLVENRFVGMKSRGVYETPGGTILLAAHRGIE